MSTKKKTGKIVELKSKTPRVKKIESPKLLKDGVIEGEYSKSVYNNGELVSFDIDWDKLKEHMKKI